MCRRIRQKMDVYANDVLSRYSSRWSRLSRLPRNGKTILHSENCPIGRYTLLYDPIDGSSNTDINLSLGSIFAIRQQQGNDTDGSASDLLQDGRKQIAAGYILMVLAPCWFIPSAREFTRSLDPSLGGLSFPR